MFGLADNDVAARIVGVGDGPSDFNAQASVKGWRVISVDPVYQWGVADLEQRCHGALDHMTDAVALAPRHWIWSYHDSVESLRKHRVRTMKNFLQDIGSAASSCRYIAAALPNLPFRSGSFDMALCAHLLFSWSSIIDLDFHLSATSEMLRVATEVRIFPTGRNLASRRSKYADVVCEKSIADGYRVRFQNIQAGKTDASSECLIISRVARPVSR
jgi:hypothetical protein